MPADPAHVRVFSYAAELAPADIALSTLVRCLELVRKIREHGIAKGPWKGREEWLNQQIAQAWQDRGPFPGLGPVLEALGMRLGTALALELRSSGMMKADADPWPTVDAILRGKQKPPQPAYAEDLKAIREQVARTSPMSAARCSSCSRASRSPRSRRCGGSTRRSARRAPPRR